MSRDVAASARRGDAGVVLVAVLWLLGLLGALTMTMAVYATNTLSTVDVYSDRLRVEAAIGTGVELAAVQLLRPDPPAQGNASATLGEAGITWDYRSENARIDVNAAAPALLAGLFTVLGARTNEASAYADRIVEMREPISGAQGQAGGSPRKRFVDVAQLDLVPGIPEALVARAKPFLTVYSGSAQINPRIAGPEVLAALPGITRERVRTMLDLRNQGIVDPQAWADALGEAQQFAAEKGGKATRIHVKVSLRDGFTSASEVVILSFDDDAEPYRILSWEDDVDMGPATAKQSSARP